MTDQIFLGDTRDFQFSTVAPSTGVPTTLAGTPVVSAYPDNGTTQITAGITLTVDHDSVTGSHNVRVVATAANGYDYGVKYTLKITTGTVDSVSAVGHVVGECYTFEAADRRLGIVDYGVAQSFTSTTAVLRAALAIPDDEIIGSILAIGNQSRVITDWDNTTDTATVDTWTTTPTGTPNYTVHRSPPASASAPVPVSVNAFLGTAITETTGNRIADNFSTFYDNADADSTKTQDDIGGGSGLDAAGVRTAVGLATANLDTQLGALPTAAENRAEMDSNSTQLAAAAVIVADWSNGGRLDLLIDAIKAKSDQMVFTKANELDVNTQSINGASVTGDGNSVPWDGA